MKLLIFNVCLLVAFVAGQRITTIQLDGVQYFVSRMNPYSPELNYFLAYQYCRSLGLQLASFETQEKAESMTQYLTNAGYSKYDFWTSGNRLGTGMFLWMSTGLPFNATFDYFQKPQDGPIVDALESNGNTSPQRTARGSGHGLEKGCVTLRAPSLNWAPEDCSAIKDFICEQTRCYYYNYGSIMVSSAQGRPITTTTTTTTELPPLLFPAKSEQRSFKTTDSLDTDEETPKSGSSTIIPSSESSSSASPIISSSSSAPSSTAFPVSASSTVTTPVVSTSTEEASKITTEQQDEDSHDDETEEDFPLEVRLKQISEEVEKLSSKETNERDIGRQSFFSLSDLIKTLQPNDKKTNPQIDSDYSNTMRVLGESLLNENEGRNLKTSSGGGSQHLQEMDPTNL